MHVILCPTELEYKILSNDRCLMSLVKDNRIAIICSGIGKIRTFYACVKHLQATSFLLTGFCGGIRGVDFADIVEPNEYIEQDFDCAPIESQHKIQQAQNLLSYSKKGVLLTQDHFVTQIPLNLEESQQCVICDMEGYSLAYFAKEYQKSFAVVKLVSDVVGKNTTNDFIQACRTLKEPLIKTVKQTIELMQG